MELVYLWVKNYKNIVEQGFNFSPRFRCEYDKDKKKLTIDENKNYVSIFPDNINITAIVGENGSGKSSLVKFIRLFLKIFLKEDATRSRFEPLSISQSLMIFYDKKKNKFLCLDYEINCNSKVKYDIEYIYEKNTFKNIDFLKDTIFPVLDYSLTYDRLMHNFSYREDYDTKFLNFPDKSQRAVYFLDEEAKTMKKIFQNYKELNDKKQWAIFEDFFHPQFITISFNRERVRGGSNINDRKDDRYIIKYLNDLRNKEEKITVKFLNLLNEIEYENERLKKIKELKEEEYKFEALFDRNISYVTMNRKRINMEYIIFKFNISDITQDEIDYLLKLSSTDIFGIDIIDKNDKKFNELSFGEQQLLKVLNIIYFLANTKDIEKLLIFLDEIDIGFHPEWQKKVIKYILQLTKIMEDKEFHLLVSSHSPFILSDIPNQNIIFLNKDEKGNCKNVTNETNITTFGANIHTLLSHGFFMKDGLMGEFAKEKIDLAIKYLNQKILTEDELNYCENIISIIGEPIIKRELQKMLDSKRLNEIDKIYDEIEFLKHRIEILRKNQ